MSGMPADDSRTDSPRSRVIIAGTRTFMQGSLFADSDRVDAVQAVVTEAGFPVDVVLCGGATGADEAGRVWAVANDIPVLEYDPSRPAETATEYSWDEDGSSAGPKRNAEMVAAADYLIAFWDGTSPGTRDVIEKARDALGSDSVHVHHYRC
jgi:hypothetical protein